MVLPRAGRAGRQWTVTPPDDPVLLPGGGRSVVHRRGDVVIRDAGAWTPAVHALLRHLEDVGFAAAPRLVGSGVDTDGPLRGLDDPPPTHPGNRPHQGSNVISGQARRRALPGC